MKPFVIAEIGVNFYDTAREKNISPLEAAKLYILEAFKAGVIIVVYTINPHYLIASRCQYTH